MAEKIARGIFFTGEGIGVESYGSVVGTKEAEGPLGKCFDRVVEDSHFGQETWEQAESRFQLEAVRTAAAKSGILKEQIDMICAGDLINQCTGSAYGLKDLEIPFMGLYGACSTMAEGLITAALFIESGAAERTAAVTSSHFSTAERQFRYPLSYGGQRPPLSGPVRRRER